MPLRGCAVLLLSLWLSSTSAVVAQSNTPAAEALFRAGREAHRRGDARTACEKLRESYRLEAAIGTLLNIAICEEALGQLASAWGHYQEVVHALDASDERSAVAREHLQSIEPRVPQLTLRRAADAPAQLSIRVGALDLGVATFDTALPMDVGAHEVRVIADGFADGVYQVELREGDRRELEVSVGAPTLASTTPSSTAAAMTTSATTTPSSMTVTEVASPSTPSTSLRTSRAAAASSDEQTASEGIGVASVLLLSGAALGVAVSAVTTVLWIDRAAVVDAHCDSRKQCDGEGYRAAQRGGTYFDISVVSASLALACVGGALALWVAGDADPSTQQGSLSLMPALAHDQVGLQLSGSL